MSLTSSRMPRLADKLEAQARDARAELEAIEKAKSRAVKGKKKN